MADATIDRLSINISSDASVAVSNIDRLASSLERLAKSAGSPISKLDSFANSINRLKQATVGFSTASLERIGNVKIPTTLSGNLEKLGNALRTMPSGGTANIAETIAPLNGLKISSTLPNNIKELSVAITMLPTAKIAQLRQLALALQPLSTVKLSSTLPNNISRLATAIRMIPVSATVKVQQLANALSGFRVLSGLRLTSVINQFARLPEALQKFQAVDLNTVVTNLGRLSSVLYPLSLNLERAARAVNSLPRSLRTYSSAARTATNASKGMSASFYSGATNSVRFITRIGALTGALLLLSRNLANCVNESNTYIENMNLFNASMGEFAESAAEYANKVQDAMGIDAGEWMRNQGVFQTLATGMGVAADSASVMSQQLTQLGYDISSFYNMPVEEAMLKIQSGIAGELEPLRRIGWDLSNARMQAELAARGIDANVASMTQAQKVALRYYLIMHQVTQVHGDMARTLASPANQLRILQMQIKLAARAIGNVLIPVMNMILPYAIGAAKAIRILAIEIAKFFGIDATFEVDYSGLDTSGMNFNVDDEGIEDTNDALENMGDQAENANDKVKELKNSVMGFDELNKLNDVSDISASDAGLGGIDVNAGNGNGVDLDIPIDTYDFMQGLEDEITRKSDEIANGMIEALRKVLPIIGTIGAGFAAWKIAESLMRDLGTVKQLCGEISMPNLALGVPMFMADLDDFAKYLEDFLRNGPTFQNVAGMISEFAGMVGDAFLMLGNLKVAGALKVVQGVGEVVVAIKDISENGPNWDNVNTLIKGLTNIAIGIGLFTGKIKFAGWMVAIQGFARVITEIGKNWDAIKQGDWSGVDKVSLIIGGLEILGGLAVALDVFGKLKKSKDTEKATEAVEEIAEDTQNIDTKVSGGLSPKLKSLAKNLGLGLLIVAEVSASAIVFVGAIIVLGHELAALPDAWQPVIDNGPTILTALGLGTALLGSIGLLTFGLGSVGKDLALKMGMGLLVLVEVGAAAALFIGEIWGIGWGLDQIRQAWEPVMEHGGEVTTAILIGTGILVAIGAAAAALGLATVATGGTLPLAFLLGAAMLIELGANVAIFLGEMWGIGWGLDQIRQAWEPVNEHGWEIAGDIGVGTAILVGIGAAAAALGVASVATVGLLPAAIAAGTAMLVELGGAFFAFSEEIIGVADELQNRLAPKLSELNPILPQLKTDTEAFANGMSDLAGVISDYTASMGEITWDSLVQGFQSLFADNPIGKFADDVDEIANDAFDLNEKLGIANPELLTAVSLLTAYTRLMDQLQELTENENARELSTGIFVNLEECGKELVNGLVSGINEKMPDFDKAIDSLKTKISDKFTGMMNSAIDQWNYVLSSLDTCQNNAVWTFNNLIRQFNALDGIGVRITGSFSAQSVGRVPHLAEGGFIDSGQLFIAREAGPELVGTMGNKNAVANNDQIVAGIEQGVMQGMMQAMVFQNKQKEPTGDVVIPLIIGNEEIARAVNRGNASLMRRGELVPQFM